MGQVAFHIKSILRIIIRKLFILWVACYIIFVREKWPNTLHLKDAFAVVHHRNLIGTHQVLPQLLKILSMTFLISLGHAGVLEINRLFAKHLGDFFQGTSLFSTQKQHTGTVTNNRFCMIFIDRFELRLGLHHNMCRYLTASDDADDVLKVGYLLVCKLIQQTGHMDRQCSAASKRFITENIEHLGVHHCRDKMKGGIGIRHHHKQCCFFMSNPVNFQLIIRHQTANFCNIKGSKSGSAGNQDGFCCFTRDEKSRTFSSNSKRSYILRTSSRSRRLILSSIVSFAVWLKCTRTI